jgi:hypothetical protein
MSPHRLSRERLSAATDDDDNGDVPRMRAISRRGTPMA